MRHSEACQVAGKPLRMMGTPSLAAARRQSRQSGSQKLRFAPEPLRSMSGQSLQAVHTLATTKDACGGEACVSKVLPYHCRW